MRRYHALLAPGGNPRDPGAWRLERGGFVTLGFLFPAPWCLVSRLWVAAAAAFALPVAAGWLLGPGPSFVASLAVGLAVGLEGREWRLLKRERAGWRAVAAIGAGNRAEAEDRLAALAVGDAAPFSDPAVPSTPNGPPPARDGQPGAPSGRFSRPARGRVLVSDAPRPAPGLVPFGGR